MNKLLVIIKNLLLALNIVLFVMFCNKIYFQTLMMFIYAVLLIFTTLVSLKDLIQKNDAGNKYNFLYILLLLITNFIILRSLFDTNFIYNSSYHMNILNSLEYYDDFKIINFMYIYQNLPYFIFMLILLIIYRELNIKERKKSNYSLISIICLIVSIFTIIPTLEIFNNSINIELGYFIFNLMLLSIEVFELVRNNHKKKEWIIYISFIFNLFAFISIFV